MAVRFESLKFPGLSGLCVDKLSVAEGRIRAAVENNDHRLRQIVIRDDCRASGQEIEAEVETSLALRDLELCTLPGETLAQCTALEQINCNNNNIEHLPPEMFTPRLLRFYCSGNPLRELPETIADCVNLCDLVYPAGPEMQYPPQSWCNGGQYTSARDAAQATLQWIRENPRNISVKAARS